MRKFVLQRLIFIPGSLRFGVEAKLSITKGHSEGKF